MSFTDDLEQARTARQGVSIDYDTREARVCGHLLDMQEMEFKVFAHLAEAALRRFVPKTEMLREIWGYQSLPKTLPRSPDAMVARIRAKLRETGTHTIECRRGYGYRLVQGRG